MQTEEESAISGLPAREEFSFINPQLPREVESSISISDLHLPGEESSISNLQPSRVEESSVPDPSPASDNESSMNDSHFSSSQVTFEVVEEGTKRRKSKLIDSNGYTYNVKMRQNDVTYWQCTVHPKSGPCNASVTQQEDNFQQGKHTHNHQPAIDAANTAKIKVAVMKKATENMFKPASAIVDEVRPS